MNDDSKSGLIVNAMPSFTVATAFTCWPFWTQLAANSGLGPVHSRSSAQVGRESGPSPFRFSLKTLGPSLNVSVVMCEVSAIPRENVNVASPTSGKKDVSESARRFVAPKRSIGAVKAR